jgi:hypothetical protein
MSSRLSLDEIDGLPGTCFLVIALNLYQFSRRPGFLPGRRCDPEPGGQQVV